MLVLLLFIPVVAFYLESDKSFSISFKKNKTLTGFMFNSNFGIKMGSSYSIYIYVRSLGKSH